MERTRNNDEPAFLNIHDVAKRYGIKPATVYAWMAQGRIPQPIRLTPGCSRWSLDDLKIWEDEKRSERCARPEWEERERLRQQREEKAVQ